MSNTSLLGPRWSAYFVVFRCKGTAQTITVAAKTRHAAISRVLYNYGIKPSNIVSAEKTFGRPCSVMA